MSGDTLVMMEAMSPTREQRSDFVDSLDGFLAGVERQAFKMASYATQNRSEALDIVQDAMLAFVRRYRKKPADQWRPLFFRTLDNKIKDWFRRRKVRLKWLSAPTRKVGDDELDVADLTADPRAADPQSAADRQLAGDVLERALCALPDRQRQAFLLRTWQGMSVAETASIMRCSEGSVKTHLSRALAALRGKLEAFQ